MPVFSPLHHLLNLLLLVLVRVVVLVPAALVAHGAPGGGGRRGTPRPLQVDFTAGSEQWRWLLADLRAVNRSRTPWVVLGGHRPMYIDSTYDNDVETMDDLINEVSGGALVEWRVGRWRGHHGMGGAKRHPFLKQAVQTDPLPTILHHHETHEPPHHHYHHHHNHYHHHPHLRHPFRWSPSSWPST